jgi:hypothetical protein
MFTVTEVGVGVYHYAYEVTTPPRSNPRFMMCVVHFPTTEATLFYSRTQNSPQFVKHSSFDTFQVAPCAMTH